MQQPKDCSNIVPQDATAPVPKPNPAPTIASPETKVVKVNVDELRKYTKYKNISEWLEDANNVYIGRQARINVNGVYIGINRSRWANPYSVKDYGIERSLELYRAHLEDLLKSESNRDLFLQLRGKTLGCWCKSTVEKEPCHGDIIVEYLEKYH